MILPFIYLHTKLQLLSEMLLVKYGKTFSFGECKYVFDSLGQAQMQVKESEFWGCGCKLII